VKDRGQREHEATSRRFQRNPIGDHPEQAAFQVDLLPFQQQRSRKIINLRPQISHTIQSPEQAD
jgi:hypothetical protein